MLEALRSQLHFACQSGKIAYGVDHMSPHVFGPLTADAILYFVPSSTTIDTAA